MNLGMAIGWFVLGVVLLVDEIRRPERAGGAALPVPLYGIAFILTVYNLVRWWSVRTACAPKENTQRMWSRSRPRQQENKEPVTPDPNFVFDEPEAEKKDPPGDRPAV